MIQSFRDLKKLPRPVWILGGTTLVNRAGTMALPYLALYLTKHGGFSVTTAGMVIAIYGVVAFFVGPIAGRLSDRLGAATLMEISLFLSGTVMLLFPLAQSLSAIIAMTVLWSLTSEAYRPAAMSLIGDLVPAAQRKTAFSFLRLAINLGMSVGPAIGGLLAQISYPAIFVVDGVTTLLAGFLLLVTAFRARARKTAQEVHLDILPDAHQLKPLKNPAFLYFLLTTIPSTVVFFQHTSTMPLFLVRELGFSEASYGFLFAVNTMIIIIFEIPITAAITHWNYRRTLSLGSFLFATGFGAMALFTSMPAMVGTVVVWTVGEMILFPSMNAYVSDMAPAKQRGQYMGAYMACFSMSFIAAPWAGTLILDRFGGKVLWIAIFTFGMLSPLLITWLKLPKTHETASNS